MALLLSLQYSCIQTEHLLTEELSQQSQATQRSRTPAAHMVS